MRNIANAMLLPDSGVIIADVPGPMRRFSKAGQFLGELGRRGQGPGEYGLLVEPQLLSNGTVWWFDNTQMRLASVLPDGKAGPVRRVMLPPTAVSLHVVGVELVILDVPAAPTLGDTVVGVYRTVPANGAPRVLGQVRTPSVFEPGTTMRRPSAPFAARVVANVGTAGDVAHSNGARYQVDVMPAKGVPWRLDIDLPRRAVSSAERDSVLAVALKRSRVTSVAALPEWQRSQLENGSSTVPPLQSMRILRDGSLWIRPTTAPSDKSARWDVFARDGRRIGKVDLPLSASVKDGTREWVLVAELGADDVPMLVRYAVGR
ncbi:MAG: hypothetical protein WC700_08800 [Gemmatimonadaceae bacterium]|jgi:hypothetical protein